MTKNDFVIQYVLNRAGSSLPGTHADDIECAETAANILQLRGYKFDEE